MRALPLLFVIALVAAACGASASDAVSELTTTTEAATTSAPTTTEQPTTTEVETAMPLGLIGDGPYKVGVTTMTLNEGSERPLTVEVWFPLEPDTEGEPAAYTFLTGDTFPSPRALANGVDQIATDGPFPLVVYSHGSGGVRYIHSDYTETLASHGYVVAAPDHTGNTAVDRFLEAEDCRDVIMVNRPNDVGAVIDAMVETEGVDGDRIALTGHSFGGFTAYAATADERIDAIIPLAPALGSEANPLITDEQLAAVTIPTLIIVGTDDSSTPVDPNVERAWEFGGSENLYRLELVHAQHQSFTDVCDYLELAASGQEFTEPVFEIVQEFGKAGCSEGDMPASRVKELTNTFALRFLGAVFVGPEFDASAMVDLSEVTELDDVIYQVR